MLRSLIAWSLRKPGTIIAGTLLALGLAFWRLPALPVDVFPDLTAPTVLVMLEAGGLAADEVEQSAVRPVEGALLGVPGLRRLRSASALSLGLVWVEFEWGHDIHRARQAVAERLATVAPDLPPTVHPGIAPQSSITGEIMLIGLVSDAGGPPLLEVRAIAENELRNHLLAVPGVSQVVAIGGSLPEFQVLPDYGRMAIAGVGLPDVIRAATESHSMRGAGYLPNVDGREIPLRQTSQAKSAADIGWTKVAMTAGGPIHLNQVADVALGGAPSRGAASVAGRPAVILSIQKATGQNTLVLTRTLDAALDAFEARLPAGVRIDREVFRQSRFIEASMATVLVVVRDALILVAAVVVLFLLNWRAALITLVALPVSLAVAVLALDLLGLGINVMTLGGLAIAIGELVDDAIIDVENVLRRLNQERALPDGERRSLIRVVFDASNEIRSSVVFATLIICMVFVPLLFLGGLEGRFFQPMAVAYIISILASLLVALSLTPALCLLLFRGGGDVGAGHAHRESPLARWLKSVYKTSLDWALSHTRRVLGLAAVSTVAALALASTYGRSFLPEFNEGTFTVFVMMPPGTSLEESVRLATSVERRLVDVPGVRSVARRTGRAERDEHAEPVSASEIEVTMNPGVSRARFRRDLDAILSTLPGVATNVGQPIEHRLSHILSGTPAALAINIYGEDLANLRKTAERVAERLKSVPSARDIVPHREVMIETAPIVYDREQLALRGLTPEEAALQVEAAFLGITTGQIADGARRINVVVRIDAGGRATMEQVADFRLHNGDGAQVPLREVADIQFDRASNLITHENGRRKAVVSCNVAVGSNLGDLVEEVRQAVDPIVREAGLSVHYGGQFESQQSASRSIFIGSLGVLVVVFWMLSGVLGSWRAAALVLVNLPLGLIGGVVGVFLLPGPQNPFLNFAALFGAGTYIPPVLSLPAIVGFVTLFGIAIRNGVLLVNHYRHLQLHEGCGLEEAVRRGSAERLVPILMTALSAILGLIPLALAFGEPGGEILAPLSVVVLCGLFTSTLLNLYVVPAAYRAAFRNPPPAAPAAPPIDFFAVAVPNPSGESVR